MQPGTPILVVEDEVMISMMLESFLEELGYPIAGTAESVSEALRLVEGGGFGMAILDLSLENGEKSAPVAEELSRLGIPFIVSSGSAEPLDGPFSGRPVLSKPYTLVQMQQALGSIPAGSLASA